MSYSVRSSAMAKTATGRKRVLPKARKEGAQQEGKDAIQAGQVDRKTKARQKAGQIAVEKQRPRPKRTGQRHAASRRTSQNRQPTVTTRPKKQSKDLGDVRGTRAPTED